MEESIRDFYRGIATPMFRKGHGELGESEKFNLTHRVQTIRDITGYRIV